MRHIDFLLVHLEDAEYNAKPPESKTGEYQSCQDTLRVAKKNTGFVERVEEMKAKDGEDKRQLALCRRRVEFKSTFEEEPLMCMQTYVRMLAPQHESRCSEPRIVELPKAVGDDGIAQFLHILAHVCSCTDQATELVEERMLHLLRHLAMLPQSERQKSTSQKGEGQQPTPPESGSMSPVSLFGEAPVALDPEGTGPSVHVGRSNCNSPLGGLSQSQTVCVSVETAQVFNESVAGKAERVQQEEG